MSPSIMAIIMVVVVIAFIIWNKVPQNFVLMVVPVLCALGLGYSLTDISGFILTQMVSTMNSVGYMLLFGLLYFNMLTETGMFDTIIGGVLKLMGKRMNVAIIFILTTVFGCIGTLTANASTAYMVCFPVLMTLYKKYKVNRTHVYIVAQTAFVVMCFLPWGIGMANSAMMAGCDTMELMHGTLPFIATIVPVIILQWIYFSLVHKKKYGTLQMQEAVVDESVNVKENPNARPQFFWFNLIVFLLSLVGLIVFSLPLYLVFMADCIITAMVNYRNNFGEIWNKVGVVYFNVFIMLIGISVYLAIFNQAPEGCTTMVTALANTLVNVFPAVLTKYTFLIFLILAPIIVRFLPYQVFNAMYPMFIAVGATFGYSAIAIIAPFVLNLGFATGTSPLTTSTYVGASLLEIDVNKDIVKPGVPIMFVSNLIAVAIAVAFGLIKL